MTQRLPSPPCIHIVPAPHGPIADVVVAGRRYVLPLEYRHVLAMNRGKLSLGISEDGVAELVVEPVDPEAVGVMFKKRYKVH